MLTVCGGLRCAVTESMRLEGEETGLRSPEHASDDCFRLSADQEFGNFDANCVHFETPSPIQKYQGIHQNPYPK